MVLVPGSWRSAMCRTLQGIFYFSPPQDKVLMLWKMPGSDRPSAPSVFRAVVLIIHIMSVMKRQLYSKHCSGPTESLKSSRNKKNFGNHQSLLTTWPTWVCKTERFYIYEEGVVVRNTGALQGNILSASYYLLNLGLLICFFQISIFIY